MFKSLGFIKCALLLVGIGSVISRARGDSTTAFNTFDGPGHPACYAVSAVFNPTSIAEAVAIVRNASSYGVPVRASGNTHMWYDTMCADDPRTVVIRTDKLNHISDFVFDGTRGSVVVEAGANFAQLSDFLHPRNATLGYTLVNWKVTFGGAIAMGSHHSSLREYSQVSASVLELDIINGKGELVHLKKDQSSDTWLAATTSLGLLGMLARAKLEIKAECKLFAKQETFDEAHVLHTDFFKEMSPYATANYWWWPGLKKFDKRTYGVVPLSTPGEAFQSTFSFTDEEAASALKHVNAGQDSSSENFVAEKLFYDNLRVPNFRDKKTNVQIKSWPVYGYSYDVLIGGLFRGTRPEWEYGLHMANFEVAVPVTLANKFLKRVRELFDEAKAEGKATTSTYRSGINIKFGKPFDSFLGQTTTLQSNSTYDWSKGALIFEFPTYLPTTANGTRYDEAWYAKMQNALIDEFPTRPHWTKNTRAVIRRTVKALDPVSLKRFAAVRAQFDPKAIFKSIVGEIIGVL